MLEARAAQYGDFVTKVKLFRDKIQEARTEAKELGITLKMRENESHFVELARGFDTDSFDGVIAEHRAAIQARIEQSQASLEVNNDLAPKNIGNAKDDDLLKQEEAQKILQELGG